jgi:FkbM family methyltransferase
MKLRIWARSLLAPKTRFLPGLGARLGAHPGLAVRVRVALRRLPAGRVRTAAYRNISLPLVTRMGELVVPVAGPSQLIADQRDPIARVLAVSGVWEPHVTAAFRDLLSPGDICVDIGANAGYFTLLASKLVGPAGHVYALEPAPSTYAMLCANLELNAVSNVTALPVAGGERDGTTILHVGPARNTGSSSIVPDPAESAAMEQHLTPTDIEVVAAGSVVPAGDRRRRRW